MRSAQNVGTLIRGVLGALAAVLIGYLGLIAAWPPIREQMPPALRWFGVPGSAATIGLVVVVLTLLSIALLRTDGGRRPGSPVAIVAGLALISALLGMAAYWRCHDDSHPTFFTPVLWTAELVKGGSPDQMLDGGACPAEIPAALHIAQLSALAAVFLSVVGVAMALFQARMDRLRVLFASSVTAVIDLDDDSKSMIAAIKNTLNARTVLAVLTDTPDRPCVTEARNQGARIITVDFTKPATVTGLSLWRKLDSLYLLSPDPAVNLSRLSTLTEFLAERPGRTRIPLIVRIDDPWQATAWRAKQFGDSNRQWAADAVGRYEVTARRLVERIGMNPAIERILICGTSQLTLALCAELSQRQLERDYRDEAELPDITIVGEDAADYLDDHEHSRRQLGLPHDRPTFTALSAKPTVPLLMSLIDDGQSGPRTVAVILVDSESLNGVGTRLAVRFPDTAIYAWERSAEHNDSAGGVSLVGQLRSYQLSMDIPDDTAHDAWELAARLIHERYAKPGGTPSTAPWPELNEFYRESNRRQVSNALWMVEAIGGHTWNTWGSKPEPFSPARLRGLNPLEQLRVMGFDEESALKMARAEHEDWCRFYRRYGWTSGATRDDARKIHTNLVDWQTIEADSDKLDRALSSLAATLSKLRELGYRSTRVQNVSR